MGKSLITHIRTQFNLADFLTKVTNGATCRRLFGNVLFDIYDDKTKYVRFDIHDNKTNQMTSSLQADLEETEEICPSGGSNSPTV